MNIDIREATENDIEEVARLHVNSWCKTYKGVIEQDYLDNMKNNIEKRIERMKNEFNLRNMLLGIKDNKIVGFVEYTLENKFSKELDIDCELCGLYIKNEYIGLGIGTELFNYVKEIFKKNNKNRMGLWCIKENKNAVNFYLKKGGKKVKEKTFTLAGKEYNEIAFIYDLEGDTN